MKTVHDARCRLEGVDLLKRTSSFARTSSVTCKSWYFCRSTASDLATPAESFGSQIIGGGAISSGA